MAVSHLVIRGVASGKGLDPCGCVTQQPIARGKSRLERHSSARQSCPRPRDVLAPGYSRPTATFLAVWLSCLLIFWNLYRALPWQIHHLNLIKLVFYGGLAPAACFALARKLAQDRHPAQGGEDS